MSTFERVNRRITLDDLRTCAAQGDKFAVLTAYDYPTARVAQEAGVHSLLIGDTMGTVILGHESTRPVPLDLMMVLGEAVRRGAPHVFLIGDMPYAAVAGDDAAFVTAARRFRDEAGCDAIKFEAGPGDEHRVTLLYERGFTTIAHLGLRPQQVLTPDGYRAQARDAAAVDDLTATARRMVAAGTALILLEAVPPEAGQAVVDAIPVPVIGCGAGPACHGHVVVTHDMLGLNFGRTPRFVPVHADLHGVMLTAMQRWVQDITTRQYPQPEHAYKMHAAAPQPHG